MAFRTNKMPVLQEKSASGAVATFNTALAMPLASCNIAVNAWQEGSGEPYPAGGSAQIWDEEWEIGKYTDGVKEDATNRLRSKNPIAVTPNTTYYFYCNTSVYNDWIVVFWYDENHTYLRNEAITQNRTFTSPNDAYYMNFNTAQDWGSKDYANNFSFNYPATDTSYHPYSNVRPIHGFSEVNVTANNVVYTIQLGQEVYGAEVDVVNGVAHVNKGYRLFDGSDDEEWSDYPAYSGFSISVPNLTTELGSRDSISNLLKVRGGASADYPAYRLALKIYILGITNNISGVTDLSSWREWLSSNNLQFVYPLAEPFDIQLTPTQITTIIGNNTIFADTGDVDLTYKDLDIAKRGNFREVFRLPS